VKEIQIIWFKRDLRLQDHRPIAEAVKRKTPTLFLYIFEPIFRLNPHYSERHFQFIGQSLRNLQTELATFGHQLICVEAEAEQVFSFLTTQFSIKCVLSYQETGMNFTFQRDKRLATLFATHSIQWHEFPSQGIIRGKFNSSIWNKNWQDIMHQPIDKSKDVIREIPVVSITKLPFPEFSPITPNLSSPFQQGGASLGLETLYSFLNQRAPNFHYLVSSPSYAAKACSRLSPYIAWGNLSLRTVVQATNNTIHSGIAVKALLRFQKRLVWQTHFIQKFEREGRIETENLNPVFNGLREDIDEYKLNAWKHGQTGYPIVDACMRSLIATGWLNFRMRAMLVSFLTHHLWQPWQAGAAYLASLFLDFEPGIHFPQFQMQAGTTALHILRIYDPVKQGLENDPNAEFIQKWLPELRNLPPGLAHKPWEVTALEQGFYNFIPGVNYPSRIVDTQKTGKYAGDILWKRIKSPEAITFSNSWLGKNVISEERKQSPPNWLNPRN